MPKITPFLWFDGKAEEAVAFYSGIFRDAKVTNTMRYGEAGPGPKGAVMALTFELLGQEFIALNGGPQFNFTPAISFFVTCDTQEQVDDYWEKLLAGGEPMQCGWLKDRYGLCWQIVPAVLGKLLQDKNADRSTRVMKTMMGMVKLDGPALQRAYDGA